MRATTSDSQSGHGRLISAMSTTSVEKRKLLASMSAEPPKTTISRHVFAETAARAISSKASRSWSLSNAIGIGRTLRPVSRKISAQAAARRAALAVHDQVVAVDLDRDAVGAQPVGDRGEAVGFLHAQLPEAAHHCRALCEARCHRQHRV